jgi:hypothetical protein
MALPVAIVLLLGMTVLGHGLLVLSRQEVRATAALRDAARALGAAETGLGLFWPAVGDSAGFAEEEDWVSVGSGELERRVRFEVFRRSLGSGFFLLRSRGMVGGRFVGGEVIWLGRERSCGIAKEPILPEK